MAKIQFDIKYRPQIESGEYKVETRSGLPARIICWDRNSKDMEILALVYDEHFNEDNEDIAEVALNGRMFPRGKDHDYDLFIITPEEELTAWEKAIGLALTDAQLIPRDKDGFANIHDIDEFIKKKSAELLDLARVALVDEQTKREDLSFSRGLRQGREEAKKSPWIPASNPPDDGRDVFICQKYNDAPFFVGLGRYKRGVWVDEVDRLFDADYWMEIPELPKEDEK